jgi:hypothetical protein
MLIKGASGLDWLDEADPDGLPAAADAIIVRQAARLAIRSCARLENVLKSADKSDSNYTTAPADALVDAMTRERDRAVGFYLDAKKRLAKIAHLEGINRRVAADSAPRPAKRKRRDRPLQDKPAKAKDAGADKRRRTRPPKPQEGRNPHGKTKGAGIGPKPLARPLGRYRGVVQPGAARAALAAALPANRPGRWPTPSAGRGVAGRRRLAG